MPSPPPNRRASRLQYLEFRRAHKLGTLDQRTEDEAAPGKPGSVKRREHLRAYVRWLKPHRSSVAVVFGLAVLTAGLQMLEPLFMRFIIDDVLLNTGLDAGSRVARLNLAGAGFLTLVVFSNLTSFIKDY